MFNKPSNTCMYRAPSFDYDFLCSFHEVVSGVPAVAAHGAAIFDFLVTSSRLTLCHKTLSLFFSPIFLHFTRFCGTKGNGSIGFIENAQSTDSTKKGKPIKIKNLINFIPFVIL